MQIGDRVRVIKYLPNMEEQADIFLHKEGTIMKIDDMYRVEFDGFLKNIRIGFFSHELEPIASIVEDYI